MAGARYYDVIIAGAGIAGLTSAAYLSNAGARVLLCERGTSVGGLVGSFDYKGYTFDRGIRAIENSGIVKPMLEQLGIDIEFLENPILIRIEEDSVRLSSKESLDDYRALLERKFPGNIRDIRKITDEIEKVMGYMDVLYGVDNPLFRDLKEDREYLVKTLLPWLARYQVNIHKAMKLKAPIGEYLAGFTDNQALIDIITQHFFKNTPSFFALGYFSLYLDYSYPKGGTGTFIRKMEEFIQAKGGTILKNTEISSVDAEAGSVMTAGGREFRYKQLIWAADMKKLYTAIDLNSIKNREAKMKVDAQRKLVRERSGGDSIYTIYMTVDMDRSLFEDVFGAHMFFTPSAEGMSKLDLLDPLSADKDEIKSWLGRYYDLTTYEISCPAVRDSSLAPPGKTGLILSTLMDYKLAKIIKENGWYEEFKAFSEDHITALMDRTIMPGMRDKVIDTFSSTPMTIERITGNAEGAITGWAFTDSIPAESRFKKIRRSVYTPIPDVLQAGQWSFSPSGLPVSILTGKLAADEALRKLSHDRGAEQS